MPETSPIRPSSMSGLASGQGSPAASKAPSREQAIAMCEAASDLGGLFLVANQAMSAWREGWGDDFHQSALAAKSWSLNAFLAAGRLGPEDAPAAGSWEVADAPAAALACAKMIARHLLAPLPAHALTAEFAKEERPAPGHPKLRPHSARLVTPVDDACLAIHGELSAMGMEHWAAPAGDGSNGSEPGRIGTGGGEWSGAMRGRAGFDSHHSLGLLCRASGWAGWADLAEAFGPLPASAKSGEIEELAQGIVEGHGYLHCGVGPLRSAAELRQSLRAHGLLAESLGLPPDHLGMGMAVRVGYASKRGRFGASFQPKGWRMNFPSPSSSLGHEWTHALFHAAMDPRSANAQAPAARRSTVRFLAAISRASADPAALRSWQAFHEANWKSLSARFDRLLGVDGSAGRGARGLSDAASSALDEIDAALGSRGRGWNSPKLRGKALGVFMKRRPSGAALDESEADAVAVGAFSLLCMERAVEIKLRGGANFFEAFASAADKADLDGLASCHPASQYFTTPTEKCARVAEGFLLSMGHPDCKALVRPAPDFQRPSVPQAGEREAMGEAFAQWVRACAPLIESMAPGRRGSPALGGPAKAPRSKI